MTNPIEEFVQLALAQSGKTYVWGAKGPDTFDCSGLVYWCAGQHGVHLPEGSSGQWDVVNHIDKDAARSIRGALVFEGTGGSEHVAISLGDGRTMEAHSAHTDPNIGIFSFDGRPWTGAGLIPGFDYKEDAMTPEQEAKLDKVLSILGPVGAEEKDIWTVVGEIAKDVDRIITKLGA